VDAIGVFPFGRPLLSLAQRDRTPKAVFILGTYSSAVHARWFGADGRLKLGAVAVASEPEMYWRGDPRQARAIVEGVDVPRGAGRLEVAGAQLNGPSGKALDELYLAPLGLSRDDAWLCDLVPHSCKNDKQAIALRREYDPVREALGLPTYDWPALPREVADAGRRAQIVGEFLESEAEVLVTLGDLPLKWFAQHYGAEADLSAYGRAAAEYGGLHPLTVAGRKVQLLPLVHPRQAARIGGHAAGWLGTHEVWVKSRMFPAPNG